MKWPQEKISDWARSQFGDHSPRAIGIRGNKEMAELLSSLENGKPPRHSAEECADVAIFLFQVCERLGYDLLELVDIKMDVNEQRRWEVAEDGSHQHVRT